MEEPSSSEPWPIFYQCPACHQEVECVAGHVAALHPCPHCGEMFVVAAEDGSTDLPEVRDDAEEKSREEELDGLRIRQLSRIRRAVIRSQSYAIVAAGGCLVGAIQLAIDGVRRLHSHNNRPRAIGYLLFAIFLALGLVHFVRLAIEYHRESRKHDLTEPTTPPDFSQLSDGSQQVRNLEELK